MIDLAVPTRTNVTGESQPSWTTSFVQHTIASRTWSRSGRVVLGFDCVTCGMMRGFATFDPNSEKKVTTGGENIKSTTRRNRAKPEAEAASRHLLSKESRIRHLHLK